MARKRQHVVPGPSRTTGPRPEKSGTVDGETVKGREALVGYLRTQGLASLTTISVDELFHHYFLSHWATRSYRLHFEPTDASTMLAEGYSEEDIRRQGRWHSYCWRRYAYDSRERMLGVAAAMAKSTYTVMTAGQDFVARRRGAGSGGGKPPSGSPCQSGRRV